MKAGLLRRICVAAWLVPAALAASAQSRPPTTEQLGKDPGALRQEAEQQRCAGAAQQQQQAASSKPTSSGTTRCASSSRAPPTTWRRGRRCGAPGSSGRRSRRRTTRCSGAGSRSAPASARAARRRLARDGQSRQRADRRHHRRDVRFDARPRHDRVPSRGAGRDRQRRPRATDVPRRVPRRRLARRRPAAGRNDVYAHDHRLRRPRPRDGRRGRLRAGARRRPASRRRRTKHRGGRSGHGGAPQMEASGNLGRERRHGRLRRALVDPQVGQHGADDGPVGLQDAPAVRGQALPVGAQRVRVRLRHGRGSGCFDDRLFGATWARERSSAPTTSARGRRRGDRAGHDYWKAACTRS